MKLNGSFRKLTSTLTLLLGFGAVSCAMATGDNGEFQDGAEPVGEDGEHFNPGPENNNFKGHEEITKRAMLYLAQHNLLPATLLSGANQALVLYGNEFGDHSYLGRPEAPTTPVPTRMTANRSTFSSDSQTFQFEIPVDWWDDPDVNTTVSSRVQWLPRGSEWQPAGQANPRMAQTALHYQVDLDVSVDVWFDSFTSTFNLGDDEHPEPTKQDHTMDNLFHYALGDVKDYGLGLPTDAGTLKFYPFIASDIAKDPAEAAGWDANHQNVASGLASRLVNQPLLSGADFGADKYGAILFQLARKFAAGSAWEPQLSDLQKVGNTVSGWRTGSMQGFGSLNQLSMTFPHSYLGGNPFICSGGSGADPCAAGKATWPIWVPATAPTASTLTSMEVAKPGRSDRVSLIYLGWATHMMQDLAAPHHAANWTGRQHEVQDDMGDNPVYWQRTQGQEQYFMDSFAAADVDALLGSQASPKSRAAICSSLGVTDSQIVQNGTNWSSVRPLFLQQAKTAYQNRKERNTTVADGATYMKNAILGTMKLLLCGAPSSVPTVGYRNTTNATGFVWAQSSTGSYVADANYSYNSLNRSNPGNTVTQTGTGSYRVDFPGLGKEVGGNVQVTAYGYGTDRCKVGGWGSNGTTLSAYVYCHNTAGALVNTQFTASYHQKAGTNYGENGGYLWADQPTAASYTPHYMYQWNSTGARNTITRNGVGSYVATFPGVNVNGGMVEVTAYGGGSEYCKIGWWGNNSVAVNCYANGGAPVDAVFTLNFTDQSPIGTPSYQYAWADQPWSASYTPYSYYQKGSIARDCGSDAGTVTMQRQSTGSYIATLPLISPTGSNVKVSAYSGAGEMCKVVGWWGNGGSGTQVQVACFDPAGNPADTYFDLVYHSNLWIIC